MFRRTKIIATMGPAVSSLGQIKKLIQAGVNVARLNFSHRTQEEHLETIKLLKQAREELEAPLAIMLDTKGPEVRLGPIEKGSLYLPRGHRWKLVKEQLTGNLERVSITPSFILERLKPGQTVLFDNGYIASVVTEVQEEGVVVEIQNEAEIKSGKAINIPDVNLELPFANEKDVSDIIFGCLHDVDIIAASFVYCAEHVLAVKELIKEQGKPDIMVVAKIENQEGVKNLDHIVQVADGIMVARGDLGVEVPMAQVPRLQKMMIRKSCLTGKPVVTATHMLESMITNPRPTRAEASDVANAIYDSTSAVMLSAETAIGRYPAESVYVMRSIAEETEKDFNYREFFEKHSKVMFHDVASSIALAAVKTAYSSGAQAIFAFSKSGQTAALLSRFRPKMPIIVLTPSRKCYHQLALMWGVVPFFSDRSDTYEKAFENLSQFALEKGCISYGDLVVITAGTPFGIQGTTNMMIVENIGDVLVRGLKGEGGKVHGKALFLHSPETKKPYFARGKLLVITRCDESYRPFIEKCSGVILQNLADDSESEAIALEMAKEFDKPTLVQANEASRMLHEGQLITLDPEKALVYKGVVLKD